MKDMIMEERFRGGGGGEELDIVGWGGDWMGLDWIEWIGVD